MHMQERRRAREAGDGSKGILMERGGESLELEGAATIAEWIEGGREGAACRVGKACICRGGSSTTE